MIDDGEGNKVGIVQNDEKLTSFKLKIEEAKEKAPNTSFMAEDLNEEVKLINEDGNLYW